MVTGSRDEDMGIIKGLLFHLPTHPSGHPHSWFGWDKNSMKWWERETSVYSQPRDANFSRSIKARRGRPQITYEGQLDTVLSKVILVHSDREGSWRDRMRRKKLNPWKHMVTSHPNRAFIEGVWIRSWKCLFPSCWVKFAPYWISFLLYTHQPPAPFCWRWPLFLHWCSKCVARSHFPSKIFCSPVSIHQLSTNPHSPVPPLTTITTTEIKSVNQKSSPHSIPEREKPVY